MEISLFMIHMFDFTKICVAYQKDDCVSKERLDLKKKKFAHFAPLDVTLLSPTSLF